MTVQSSESRGPARAMLAGPCSNCGRRIFRTSTGGTWVHRHNASAACRPGIPRGRTASPVEVRAGGCLVTATDIGYARPTMTVRIADRRHDPVGHATIVTVTIPAVCPTCGGPRGEPQEHRFSDDGDWKTCDRWNNACGHVDMYEYVLAEVARVGNAP